MSLLSDAIKALDPTPNKATELTLALGLLSELSESKVRQFTEDVATSYRTAGTNENRTAPITTVVASHSEYRAYVKQDVSKIATDVSTAIKKFVSGGAENIITGIADLVTTGLTVILGSGQATQQEMRSYYITVQARALVRYDIIAWRRLVEATAITSRIEACLAVYASKASVDVGALDLNTFLLGYEDQLAKMNFPEKEIQEYLDTAEAAYKRLRGDSGGTPPGAVPVGMVASRGTPPRSVPAPMVTSPEPRPLTPGELIYVPELSE